MNESSNCFSKVFPNPCYQLLEIVSWIVILNHNGIFCHELWKHISVVFLDFLVANWWDKYHETLTRSRRIAACVFGVVRTWVSPLLFLSSFSKSWFMCFLDSWFKSHKLDMYSNFLKFGASFDTCMMNPMASPMLLLHTL